ncbi:MAG TPA: hypothetical protein VD813_01000 [Pseudonocardia sp.]|nr:hypothetical protein [Pseudonocardia sp.]
MAAVAGVTVALGVGVSAGTASAAISQGTIKSECQQAGGSYYVSYSGGYTWSSCTYTAISGGVYRDYYCDGEYYSTRRIR